MEALTEGSMKKLAVLLLWFSPLFGGAWTPSAVGAFHANISAMEPLTMDAMAWDFSREFAVSKSVNPFELPPSASTPKPLAITSALHIKKDLNAYRTTAHFSDSNEISSWAQIIWGIIYLFAILWIMFYYGHGFTISGSYP
jgi:hypothetical protein